MVEKVIKLNLGCGIDLQPGYINIDIRVLPGIDMVLDISEGLPFVNETVDFIWAVHVIEHVRPQKLKFVLKECHRVLKINGILIVYCPNGRAIVKDYMTGKINAVECSGYLMGRQNYADNTHRIFFDIDRLEEEVKAVGFRIMKTELNRTEGKSYPYDIGVEVIKINKKTL